MCNFTQSGSLLAAAFMMNCMLRHVPHFQLQDTTSPASEKSVQAEGQAPCCGIAHVCLMQGAQTDKGERLHRIVPIPHRVLRLAEQRRCMQGACSTQGAETDRAEALHAGFPRHDVGALTGRSASNPWR